VNVALSGHRQSISADDGFVPVAVGRDVARAGLPGRFAVEEHTSGIVGEGRSADVLFC